MRFVSAKSRVVRSLILAFCLAAAAPLLAEEDSRCEGCEGFCGGGDFSCGLCIVEAVQAYCSEWGPGAYAECHGDNDWEVFCDN